MRKNAAPPGLTRCPVLIALVMAGACVARENPPAVEEQPSSVRSPNTEIASDDPALLPAELMPLAGQALLIDIARVGQRAIAVGRRGDILLSGPISGTQAPLPWRQIEGVPTRSLLTAVTVVGADVWAVGHDQVILHSADGGLHWERQYVNPYRPGADDVANGAPLLDVLFLDVHTGIAIGAYGLMLRTHDGGRSWARLSFGMDPVVEEPLGASETPENPSGEPVASAAADEESESFSEQDLELEALSDPHLNAIARTGDGSLFMVAERGTAFRSRDGGASWERLNLPYQGSMFGVLGYAGSHVLVFGLRGHAFESTDLGDNWTELDTGTELTLQGGAVFGDSGAVLVGNNGLVLMRSQAGAPLQPTTIENGGILSAIVTGAAPGSWWVTGENGVFEIPGSPE